MPIPSTGKVLVQFGAKWCSPCKQIAPFVKDLAAELQVQHAYLDIEETPLANELMIRNLPTVVAFKDGKEISRLPGASRDQIRKFAAAAFA